MDFAESTQYLYSLGNEVSTMKLGLHNIRRLLAALGDPQNSYLEVQVAGTNGKGSVCAFLEAMCLSAGIGTGVYTSPHLISIIERIKINGHNIDQENFSLCAKLVRETAEALQNKGEIEHVPTFFEQVTAIALHAFAESKVELAILETGLGGRLDATTAANAAIAGITQIDYDHQEYLGNTLAEIATEKSAIIHGGSKVVISAQHPVAERVIGERCEHLGIKASWAGAVRTTDGSGWLKFKTDVAEYEIANLSLLGRHQIENAKVAILLAETLQDHFPITAGDITHGLQNARHPGRLEFWGRYLFDGAHNAAGARALREFLSEFIARPITMIFGAMKEKDVGEMSGVLFPMADKLILTQPENSRSMPIAHLSDFLPMTDRSEWSYTAASVGAALKLAATISPPENMILITGSLYIVGEAKKILNN